MGLILAGDKKKNRLGMALIAGSLGALLGHSIDQRRCRLKKIAKSYKLQMEMSDIAVADLRSATGSMAVPAEGGTSAVASGDEASKQSFAGLVVMLRDDGNQFASGSDQLTAQAEKYFGAIADTYAATEETKALGDHPSAEQSAAVEALRQRVVMLVGHTDDVGDSASNAGLSERRARAVAALFRLHGVPEDKIFFQGAGETLPIADNRLEEGRARNRRVEIVDLPDSDSLAAFIKRRLPRVENYRPVATAQAEEAPAIAAAPHEAKPEERPASAPRKRVPARRTPPAAKLAARPAPASRAPMAPAPQSQAALRPDEFDFAGQPAAGFPAVDIGPVVSSRGISAIFIPSAHAATLQSSGLASCSGDRPRYAYAVKSLRTGAPLPFSTGDFMRGLYDTSWSALAGPHLVALTHVSVLRDGGTPATRPTLMVFRDYARHPSKGAKPALTVQPQVNVYRGERGVLYRVFAGDARNLRCVDLVVPSQGGFSAPASSLIYLRGSARYRARWTAKVAGH